MIKVIAALIVLFIVNAFLVLAILRSANRINEKVNRHFIKKISEIVPPEIKKDEVVEEINEVADEEEYIESNFDVNPEVVTDQSLYKTVNLKDNYKNIKERMNIDNIQVIKDVISENKEELKHDQSGLYDLVNMLDLDTVYNLNTLSINEQLSILNETLNDAQKEVLDEYINENNEFNIVSFYDYIKRKAIKEDSKFYIKTGYKEDYYDDMNKDIVTVYDGDITEGIKIVHKDKIYDYSI